MVKIDGDFAEYNIVVEQYKTKTVCMRDGSGRVIKDEEGKSIKEKIDVYKGFKVVPTFILREGITLYGPAQTIKNQTLKTRCTIFDKFTNKFYVVKHTTEEIAVSLRSDKYECLGFKIGR